MMNTKTFIKDKLEQLLNKFKHLKVSVQYEYINSAYYVQIQPSDFFNESADFKTQKRAILDEFYENYFESTLTFIDKDSLLALDAFDYTLEGVGYINEAYLCLTKALLNFNNEITTRSSFDAFTENENNYALAA